MTLAGRRLGYVFQHSTLLGLCQHRLDGFNKISCRFDAKFHRDSRSWTCGLIDEVDIQGVFQWHVVRMVVGNVGFGDLKPTADSLASATVDLCLVHNHGTHSALPYSNYD